MVAPPEDGVTTARVASSDGVELTVHHLAAGEAAHPLLVAHATGFHGRAYGPMADRLAGDHDVWALDFRGHGATAKPPGAALDWARYADDALAVAQWLARRAGDGTPLVAFGHSMGGATLLMAAERQPGLFASLVLYEPIVFPPPGSADEALVQAGSGPPLAEVARRRRRSFESFGAALANYAAKPPMSAFDPAALEAYVRGGLRPVDPAHPDGPVELCCSPETEAATFEGGASHDTWNRLGRIAVPTTVLGGVLDAPPPRMVEPIASRLPNGRAELHPELDHFAPFSEPARTAQLVSAALASAHPTS
jgi:pimeloyl-ACP methyl ester carboxylesterase